MLPKNTDSTEFNSCQPLEQSDPYLCRAFVSVRTTATARAQIAGGLPATAIFLGAAGTIHWAVYIVRATCTLAVFLRSQPTFGLQQKCVQAIRPQINPVIKWPHMISVVFSKHHSQSVDSQHKI